MEVESREGSAPVMDGVVVERTGPDWAEHATFYAQRFVAGYAGDFAFGATETEALANLIKEN